MDIDECFTIEFVRLEVTISIGVDPGQRRAIRLHTADHQIEVAIVVVIDPGHGRVSYTVEYGFAAVVRLLDIERQ